jgi:hypothetical protein
MRYWISLPKEAKRDFFTTDGLPRIAKGAEPVKVDLSKGQKQSLERKGLRVATTAAEKEDEPTNAAKQSRRKEKE